MDSRYQKKKIVDPACCTQARGVKPASLQVMVIPFLSFIGFTQSIKKAFRLHYSTLEIFLCIVHKHYINGQGCTTTYFIRTLHCENSASMRRSINYRLDTLIKYDLIYSIRVKNIPYYFLSDKSKGILEGLNEG